MAVRRLPGFMNQDTMATLTPSRSKEWRSYNIWPPAQLQRERPRVRDENWEMVKSGVFTEGETYKETVDKLYDHETRITEIDKFLVKQRMKEERCYYREHRLVKREQARIARANAIVRRKKQIKEENLTRDAVLKAYGQFKEETEQEAESFEEFAHDPAALDEMRQRREIAHMDQDMATLLTDVALGSGSITLAKTIRTEIKNTELITSELAQTLDTAQKKNHHRSELLGTLKIIHSQRIANHQLPDPDQWAWGGPRGSSPRRATLEFRAAKLFQKRWRGFASRSVEHRAASVLNVVDERSANGSSLFEATAMRMVAEKGQESSLFFDGRLEENARHIRLLTHNLRKFQAASRRLEMVEEDWKVRATDSRESNRLETLKLLESNGEPVRPGSRPSLSRRSSLRSFSIRRESMAKRGESEGEGGFVEAGLLEEGMALHKERAIVDAAIQYTAASVLQRLARIIQVENGTYIAKVRKREHSAHEDLRRNQSRSRVEQLWELKEAKRMKAMIIGFTMFQQKIRHFLENSVVERASKATIGRLVIRHKYNTIGAKLLQGLREQRHEALHSAVTSTIVSVRHRLIQIMAVWSEWAQEQKGRRAWLSNRDVRRRALIIEDMLHARLLLKREVRAGVLRDMSGSMTRVLTKYKQSKWDWCSLLVALDDEMHRVDPDCVIAKRILEKPRHIDKERLRRLQGHRSPLNPHKALLYLLNNSTLFKRVPVPARKSTLHLGPTIKGAPTPLFPEIVSSVPAYPIKRKGATPVVEEDCDIGRVESVLSPSGRFSALKSAPASKTWNAMISDELMFADELMKKQDNDQPTSIEKQSNGKFKLKVGGGEVEPEARRLEARKDDAHVHRHLTIPLWRFLGACGEFFQKCSSNAVRRGLSDSIAEEREMLDGFLGKFLEVRQESLPYIQTDKLKKVNPRDKTRPFYRWLHESEYCPQCYGLAAHPTGEGYGVTDKWSDISDTPPPPKRKCPSCGYRFISRYRANTGMAASRLRSRTGVASQDISTVTDLDEPVASLFLHAAIATLAPVGSWNRDKGLNVVWFQAVEVAKPIIDRALNLQITTIAELAERRGEIATTLGGTHGELAQGQSEEGKVLDKAVAFLKILDELIIRRREERKEADLALLSDHFQLVDQRNKQALRIREVAMEAAQTTRVSIERIDSSGRRSVRFEGGDVSGGYHSAQPSPGREMTSSRESKKTSGVSSLFGDFPSAPSTPLIAPTMDRAVGHKRSASKRSEKKKLGGKEGKKVTGDGMFMGAEYRIRPLHRSL